MNTLHYSNLFAKLDQFVLKPDVTDKEDSLEIPEYICCEDMKIIKDETFETCKNCGSQRLITFELERPNMYLNQNFHNSTLMGGYSNKFFMVKRIHRNSNYDYKEITLLKSLKVVDDICRNFDLPNVVLVQSRNLYKNLYIDKKISSRNNIKRAVYVYCVYNASIHNGIKINLSELIKYQDITIDHFEKAIKKIEPDLIFMNKKLIKYHKICLDNKLDISEDVLLKAYENNYYMKDDINMNSIIIGTIYDLIKDTIKFKKFIKLFKTTKITLTKFNNLKK